MIRTSPNLRLTLDTIDDALFYQRPLTPTESEAFTLSIISMQIPSGPRAGLFNHGIAGREAAPRLFSGERLYTLLAARHTLLIDSARLLTLLGVKTGAATRALELASQKMEARCYAGFCAVGECRYLTVAFMRYLIASAPPGGGHRLDAFFNRLVAHRDGQGKWGSFPFFYTLLMLSKSESPQAAEERLYAAPACAALLDRPWKDDPTSRRRKTILERTIKGATHFRSALHLPS
jgi:hypothetical protein